MEREPPEVARRLMRAARSLNYNRELQPLVEERIERAEGKLRGYLLARGLTRLRLGAFQVEMGEGGAIDIERVPLDDNWRQMPLSVANHERQPDVVSGSNNGSVVPAADATQREHQEQEPDGEAETIIYGGARETYPGRE